MKFDLFKDNFAITLTPKIVGDYITINAYFNINGKICIPEVHNRNDFSINGKTLNDIPVNTEIYSVFEDALEELNYIFKDIVHLYRKVTIEPDYESTKKKYDKNLNEMIDIASGYVDRIYDVIDKVKSVYDGRSSIRDIVSRLSKELKSVDVVSKNTVSDNLVKLRDVELIIDKLQDAYDERNNVVFDELIDDLRFVLGL